MYIRTYHAQARSQESEQKAFWSPRFETGYPRQVAAVAKVRRPPSFSREERLRKIAKILTTSVTTVSMEKLEIWYQELDRNTRRYLIDDIIRNEDAGKLLDLLRHH